MKRERIVLLAAGFVVVAVALVFRLAQLQLVQGAKWEREAERLGSRSTTIPFLRGGIFDRAGRPLARDEECYALDFELASFLQRSPIAQVAIARTSLERGALDAAGHPRSEVTFLGVAASPATSALALATSTPARFAEIEPAADRDPARQAAERALGLARRDRRLREAIRRRDPRPLLDLFAVECRSLAPRIEQAVADLRALDRALAQPDGSTLGEIEQRRLECLADVEVWIHGRAASSEQANAVDAPANGRGEASDASATTGDAPEARLRELDPEEIPSERRRLRRMREGYLERFTSEVGYGAAELVAAKPDRYPGFAVVESTARRYLSATLPRLVGEVARRTAEQEKKERAKRQELLTLAQLEAPTDAQRERLRRLQHEVPLDDYEPGDVVGVSGIERAFEAELRGKRGSRVEPHSRGGEREPVEVEPPEHGRDLGLTIDLPLQAAAERALRAGVPGYSGGLVRGALVVVDVKSGDVLALAAAPDVTRDEWDDPSRRSLLMAIDADRRSTSHPLHHRAWNPYVPPAPGSVFKIVTAIAALEAGLITPASTCVCNGRIGTLPCEAHHGEIDLRRAIEQSCNVYFGWLAERVGFERLEATARRFGFGERTGFHPAEVAGIFQREPRDAAALHRFGIGYWMTATPLQVARSYAAIARGGSLPRLRFVRALGGADVPLEPARELAIAPEHLSILQHGLRDVVTTGTARTSGLEAFKVAGKTGTAEADSQGVVNQAWFAGYAPFDAPTIAFAIYCERVPVHGKDVAPILAALFASDAAAPYLRPQ